MALLRIASPGVLTDRAVALLDEDEQELAVIPGASRLRGGDLVLAEVPRARIERAPRKEPGEIEGMHIAVEGSEPLYRRTPDNDSDDDAFAWSQMTRDVHETARLPWIDTLLIVSDAMITVTMPAERSGRGNGDVARIRARC